MTRDDAVVRREELNVALAGLGRAEKRVHEFARSEPGLPLRLAVVECLMWVDTIREGLGLQGASQKSPLTVQNMPWHVFGGRLNDPSEHIARQQAVELIHGFRWARNRALHLRLLKVEGVGGGVTTPMVTPMVTRPAERWLWDDASGAHSKFPDPEGETGYRTRLLGREVPETVAEIRQLYEGCGEATP
jgi:hypothetical protein